MSERSVPVIYQGKRKLVNINFGSFENAVSSIGHRLNVTDMQLFGKRSKNEEYFEIEDDGDLEGLGDVEGLVLLVKNLSLVDGDPSKQQRGEGDQATGRTSSCQGFLGEKDTASIGYRGSSSADEAGGSPYSPSGVALGMPYLGYPTSSGVGMPYAIPVYEKPPRYAESDIDRSLGAQSAQEPAPRSQANRSKAKITAIYGEKTKKIEVEKSNFEAIHKLTANRFKLPGDFRLQVKDESGNIIDIDSDEDAADNIELMHTVWVTIPAKITAIYGAKTKKIDVERSDFEAIHKRVRGRFELRGDFELQVKDESGHMIDIGSDEDAADNVKLMHTVWVTIPDKITAICGDQTKNIVVERSNFKAIHKHVRDRFKLQGDFRLQVKDESAAGNMINIDSDEDAADNVELMHTVWVTIPVLKERSLVVVGEVEYSITEIPGPQSKIVKDALATLQTDLNIPSISEKLNEVEECIRIVYFASMESKKFHDATGKIQFDVKKFCGEFDNVMLFIKKKTNDILEALQNGFGYLLEGREAECLAKLQSVGPIAEEIQKTAESIKPLLKSQVEDRMDNLAQVGYRDEDAIAAEKERNEKERQTRQKRVDERSKDIAKSESELGCLAEREQGAAQAARQHLKSDSGIGFGFKKLITIGGYQGNKSRSEHEERIAREMREEQARERERLDKLKDEEMKAKIEFYEFVASLKAQPKEMSEVAVQGARSGLKTFLSFLQFLALFLEQTGAQCKSLNTGFINHVKLLESRDPEYRNNIFWTSKVFKHQTVNYIAQFVALQAVFEDFHENMKKVLDKMHRCMRHDNPTQNQAKAQLPMLMQQFKKQTEARRQ